MIMKDYTLNKEDKRTFILNYEIKDNKIIVNFASGKKYEVPYTEENEKIILTLMEEQVLNSKRNLGKFKNASKVFFAIPVISLCFFILGYDTSVAELSKYFFTCCYVCSITLSLCGAFYYRGLAKDIQKNLLFLNYEDLFKSKEKTDDDVLTEEETVRETITLNDIDKMSYNEVKEMVDIASFNDEVGLDFTEVPKAKVKSKARALRK